MDLARRLDLVEQENLLLRERIAFLEEALMGSKPLPVEWQLTPSEERVFGALLNRELASKETIMAALYADRGADEAEIKIVDVLVCKLRRKLRPFGVAIHTSWGRGYFLDRETRERFRRREPTP